MVILKRRHIVDVETFRDKLLLEEGIKNFRYLKKGLSLIKSMKLIEFRPYISLDDPAIYIKSLSIHKDAPFVLQQDRIIVKAENQTKAKELIDFFTAKYDTVGALEADLNELMKGYESKNLEFKASYRFYEKDCLKTICAFLNSEGGILFIGVSDEKDVIGLSKDYEIVRGKNRDGFENNLVNKISSSTGKEFMKFISITFHKLEDKEICKVKVNTSNKPAYLKMEDIQEYYIRTGNSSRSLSMEEAIEYIKDKWG